MLLGDFGDAVAITVHVVYFSVFLYNAVPYIGFGFLDNFIMIVAVSPAANSRPLCQYYDFKALRSIWKKMFSQSVRLTSK